MPATSYSTAAPFQDGSRFTDSIHSAGHRLMASRTLESHAAFLLPFLERGMEVLDAGCGPGTITQGVAETVLPGRVTGLAADLATAEHAAALAQGRELMNLRFVSGNPGHLPFANHTFDLVFCHAFSEFARGNPAALREFRRVLRPGGTLVLSDPDWSQYEATGSSPAARDALAHYCALAKKGTHTTGLSKLLVEAEFENLAAGEMEEECESLPALGAHIAFGLMQAGTDAHALEVERWSRAPGSRFRQKWQFAAGLRWNR